MNLRADSRNNSNGTNKEKWKGLHIKTITRKKFNIYGTIFDDISVNLKNNIKILFIDIIKE